MRVIGLDLGLCCGYAWTDTDGPAAELSGEWALSGSKHEGGGMRFVRFDRLLRELVDSAPPAAPGELCRVAIFYEIALSQSRHVAGVVRAPGREEKA